MSDTHTYITKSYYYYSHKPADSSDRETRLVKWRGDVAVPPNIAMLPHRAQYSKFELVLAIRIEEVGVNEGWVCNKVLILTRLCSLKS